MAETLNLPTRAGGLAQRAADAGSSLVRSVTLAVEGMHCGGCMRKVETGLATVPGVAAARANLSERRVTIWSRTATEDTQRYIDALAAVGFKSAEVEGNADDDQRSAERDMLRRMAVAGFAAANVMLLSVSVWFGHDMVESVRALFHWLSALIALPAVAYAGMPFFRSAAGALAQRSLNMDVPISLGVVLASSMSLYQTISSAEHVYFDAAITLVFFLLIGRVLDSRMRVRAAGAAANLIGLQASSATVIGTDGALVRLPARALRAGMRILVAAGERVAVDGKVTSGVGEVDDSLITGESIPRRVAPGDRVYAGSINANASLTVEATATDAGTVLAEIARLMAVAEQGRGRYVRLADRAARIYAPAVHILGLATFLGWLAVDQGWEQALTAAVAVLIITCPCALALAVPAVQVAAAGRLFAGGVIVKAPDGLERLAECDTIVFDKTGTLTTGTPRLEALDTIGLDHLRAAAAIAATSRHPYARALVVAAAAQGIDVVAADGVVETPGYGLARAVSDGEERLGSALWCGIEATDSEAAALWFKPALGAPVSYRFEDTLRADAKTVVAALSAAGYRVELLSGDRIAAAEAAARDLAIGAFAGRQTPADKIARLEALKAEGRRVLMIGDGLNDAPALAAGHASLSPSSAADISQTAADAVFQGDRLAPVVEILAIASESRRMALQNFAIALGYNAVFVPLAISGLVTPLVAALAMSASSIAVTANAVRLRAKRVDLRRITA